MRPAAATGRTSAEFASVTTVTMATVANATKRAWMPRHIMLPAACTTLSPRLSLSLSLSLSLCVCVCVCVCVAYLVS